MTEPGEITMLKAGDDLHICPACRYALGFHTSFLGASAGRDNPIKSTREVYRVILICPECGARYDVGWRVSLAESGSRVVRTPEVPAVAPSPAPLVTSPVVLPLPPARHDEPPPA